MNEYVIAKYLRLSLEDADIDPAEKDESNSISNQRKLLDGHIEKLGIKDATVIEFVDDGYSGTSFERPDVKRLLELAKKGKIHCIIVKDFSRWGRDYIAVSDYLEQIFPFLQIRFISVNDQYDSDKLDYGSAGMVDVGFKNIMNDLYCKELSQKLKLTKQQLFREGKYHSSFAFYGYLKSKKEKYKLVIENNTANVVRKIFKWADRGMRTTQIAKKLNDKKVPTPMAFLSSQDGFKQYLKSENHGKMWTSSSVLRILKDERYTGKCIYGRTKVVAVGSRRSVKCPPEEWVVVPEVFPVIILQERFDRVQGKLRTHRKTKKHNYNRMFIGNIRCGHCGYSLSYHPGKFPYYQCHTNAIAKTECHGNRILEGELLDIVLNTAKVYARAILDKDVRVDNKRRSTETRISELRETIRQYESKRMVLVTANNELFEALIDGRVDDEAYKRKTAVNTESARLCQETIDKAREELILLSAAADVTPEKSVLKKLVDMQTITKDLIDLLVKSIEVFPGGKINIVWNFSQFYDIMVSDEADDNVSTETLLGNRVWIYFCSSEGWEHLNSVREQAVQLAGSRNWTIVGDSFDNAGLSLTANGFKEMQRAVRQGRVDKVIVPTLAGVKKDTEVYQRFERGILKRKAELYDLNGNLLIG